MRKIASPRRINVAILALEGCMPSGVMGIGDMLAIANAAIARKNGAIKFKWHIVSTGTRDVAMARGMNVAAEGAITANTSYDVILVPGFLADLTEVTQRLTEADRVASWLRRQHGRGAVVGGSCTGVFVLAEAGLLDGRRATTTWWLQSELKQRYPRIDLSLDAVVTESDRVICAAGPISWVDLVLRIVDVTAGAETARACADFAVLDTSSRTQTSYLPQGYLLKRDPWLVKAEMIVRRSSSEPIGVSRLAEALGVPERTLHRKIKALAGEPPQAFITRIRMEMARTLLETTTRAVKDVADAVGYEDETTFRKAFRKLLAMSPKDYRARKAIPSQRRAS
jgi:transcriptional regulator GlxA family with amidase domain